MRANDEMYGTKLLLVVLSKTVDEIQYVMLFRQCVHTISGFHSDKSPSTLVVGVLHKAVVWQIRNSGASSCPSQSC